MGACNCKNQDPVNPVKSSGGGQSSSQAIDGEEHIIPPKRLPEHEGNHKVQDFYEFGDILGKGHFAVVYSAVEKKTRQEIAIKVIDKKKVGMQFQMLEREVTIMDKMNHTHIVNLIELFDEPTKLYLCIELVVGGELLNRIEKSGSYSEKDAAWLVGQMCQALCHIHDKHVCHRDLKPENLLMVNDQPDATVKIADFGVAVEINEGEKLTKFIGTPDNQPETFLDSIPSAYLAPEILRKEPYTMSVDMWAMGVILYIMLSGSPPFYDEDKNELYHKIKTGKYSFPSPTWDDISHEAKDLVKRLLNVNPTRRLTARQLLNDPWVKTAAFGNTRVLQQTVMELRKFNARRKLKGAVKTVVAMNRLRSLTNFSSQLSMNPMERSDPLPPLKKRDDRTLSHRTVSNTSLASTVLSQHSFGGGDLGDGGEPSEPCDAEESSMTSDAQQHPHPPGAVVNDDDGGMGSDSVPSESSAPP